MADNMDPDLEYLSPYFDPGLLTVPRLRSILVAHNIMYPASAKKTQLIDLFNLNVVPQAKKILSNRARTKRSTRGISDVPSSQEASNEGDDSDEQATPPPVLPQSLRQVSRRTPRTGTEEVLERTTAEWLPSTAKPSRRPSSKHARDEEVQLDSETDTKRPASRRTRQSLATPIIKHDELEINGYRGEHSESPFSSDNPFQSGSSPIAEAPKERKRRTLGPAESKDLRKAQSARRKTDFVTSGKQAQGAFNPISRTFDFPARKIRQRLDEEVDVVTAGEEFTPEETMALAQHEADSGKAAIPLRRKNPVRQSSSVARVAPWAVSIAMLGGLAFVWRQEKLEVGYCGIGRASIQLAGVQIPDWASLLQPQCEPCPPHAYCYQYLKTVCEPDFVLQSHPLSLNGLVPVPPTCEPDGEKARKVKAVADRAIEELRERNAKFECGELKDESGKRITAPELDEQDLKKEVSDKRRKGMSQEEFEDLWHAALGEMTNREEVVSGVDGQSAFALLDNTLKYNISDHRTLTDQIPRGSHRTTDRRNLRSTSLARVPLPCAARRSIRLALARHLGKLIGIILLAASAGYTRRTITSGRDTDARAKQFASLALDRLATQAALSVQDPDRVPEAGIDMSQLRDDVLRHEFPVGKRQKLWAKVQKKVEGNANVRPMVRQGRSGDVGRMWEWVGALPAIEAAPSLVATGSANARYSLGPVLGGSLVASSPVANWDVGLPERRKWDEGRPIY